jgi:hypothetical protein
MKGMLKLLTALVFAVGLAGCMNTVPLQKTHSTTIQAKSLDTVKNAIMQAGQERQWIMKPVAPGVIDGTLIVRTHTVKVRISYNTQGYKIDYVDSTDMKAADGKIHRKYGLWVQNLDGDIQRKLGMVKTR